MIERELGENYFLENIQYIENPHTTPPKKTLELSIASLYVTGKLPPEFLWSVEPLTDPNLLEIPFVSDVNAYLNEQARERGLTKEIIGEEIRSRNQSGESNIPYLGKNQSIILTSDQRTVLMSRNQESKGTINFLSMIADEKGFGNEELATFRIANAGYRLNKNKLESKGVGLPGNNRCITIQGEVPQDYYLRTGEIFRPHIKNANQGVRYLLIRHTTPRNS